MARRVARWGAHIYQVRVTHEVDPLGVVYYAADSITVSNGALMLAAEEVPYEELDNDDSEAIETLPCAVFAPGQWYSAIRVDHKLQPMLRHDPHRVADDDSQE